MAKVEMNAITEHLRGRVGDVIFKRQFGRLITALRPKKSLAPPTQSQREQQTEFQNAVVWAKKVVANPPLRAIYAAAGAKRGQNAFSAAVGDYFKPPAVNRVNLDAYHGLAGQKIAILASDDVEVVSVSVVLRGANNAVVEQGQAVLANNEWTYTATTTLTPGQAITIEVTAKDHPGNIGDANRPFTRPV